MGLVSARMILYTIVGMGLSCWGGLSNGLKVEWFEDRIVDCQSN